MSTYGIDHACPTRLLEQHGAGETFGCNVAGQTRRVAYSLSGRLATIGHRSMAPVLRSLSGPSGAGTHCNLMCARVAAS